MGKTMPKSTVIYGQQHAVRAASFSGSDMNDIVALIRDKVGPEVVIPKAAINKAVAEAKANKKMKDAYIKIGLIDGDLILRCKEKKFFGDIEIDVVLVKGYKPKASKYEVIKQEQALAALEKAAAEREKEREKQEKAARLHKVMNTPNEHGETMRERLLQAAEKGKKLGVGKGTQEALAAKGLHVMDERYHGEVLDHQKNRYGRHLKPLKDVWDKAQPKGLNFSQWLDEVEKGNKSVAGVAEALTLRNSDTGGLIVERGGTAGGTMVYLDEEGRKPYVARVGRGTIAGTHIGAGGEVIFVIGPDNKVYAGKKARAQAGVRGAFNHSSFFSGGPVKSAGTLQVSGGQITQISDLSGHYTPTPAMVVQAIRKLGSQDAAWLDKVKIVIGSKPPVSGTAYLAGEAQARQTEVWSKYSHGKLTSAWAEDVLKNGEDGSWLVRANRNDQLTVSSRKGDALTHSLIMDLGKLGLDRKKLIVPGKLPPPRPQTATAQPQPQATVAQPKAQTATPKPSTQSPPPLAPRDEGALRGSPAFHGILNRVDAEALLRDKPNRAWLLREGSGKLLVFSRITDGKFEHAQINTEETHRNVVAYMQRFARLAVNK